eukprot:Tbor_TRINITY_DN5521_c8_g1::TRINITY_DN5521_c8_g1_i1::g.13048::m.13048
MNFFKNALSDIQTKYRVGKAVSDATNTYRLHINIKDTEEVIKHTDNHPTLVLQCIYDNLRPDEYISATTLLTLELLEILVNNCNYSFHKALENYSALRSRLVDLCCISGDTVTNRTVKSAAKRLILELSRMFSKDEKLLSLSKLAKRVEDRSGKRLLRSIIMEKRRVFIKSPTENDIIIISPIIRAQGQKPRFPLVSWQCSICSYINKGKLNKCAVCASGKPNNNNNNN